MQGVLIDDHRIHVDFSQSVSLLSAHLYSTWTNSDDKNRYLNCPRAGAMLPSPSAAASGVDLVVSLASKRSASIEQQRTLVNEMMIIIWSSIRMRPRRDLIGTSGPTVEAHRGSHNGKGESVGVLGGTHIVTGTEIDPTAGVHHGEIPTGTETVDITTVSGDGIAEMTIDTGKGDVVDALG